MKLSISLGGVRPNNWMKLYLSIPNATTLSKDEYEVIFVSPFDPPSEMKNLSNVRFIKDYGNPTRSYQLGLLHSKGEYWVLGAADDGIFSPTLAIDRALESIPKHDKGIVSFRYSEGAPNPAMKGTEYWYFKYHKLHRGLPHVSNEYMLIMCGLMKRSYIMDIGGWDCRIEQCGLSNTDLAVRLQNDGAEMVLGEKLLELTHLPGNQGDHGPVFSAFKSDMILYKKIYSSKQGENRARIDFDNWKQSPDVWDKRWPSGMPS